MLPVRPQTGEEAACQHGSAFAALSPDVPMQSHLTLPLNTKNNTDFYSDRRGVTLLYQLTH